VRRLIGTLKEGLGGPDLRWREGFSTSVAKWRFLRFARPENSRPTGSDRRHNPLYLRMKVSKMGANSRGFCTFQQNLGRPVISLGRMAESGGFEPPIVLKPLKHSEKQQFAREH
jgi:hypothetical protein